jgi:hypothetical protein
MPADASLRLTSIAFELVAATWALRTTTHWPCSYSCRNSASRRCNLGSMNCGGFVLADE